MLVLFWINPCSLVNFCNLKQDIQRKERFSPAVKNTRAPWVLDRYRCRRAWRLWFKFGQIYSCLKKFCNHNDFLYLFFWDQKQCQYCISIAAVSRWCENLFKCLETCGCLSAIPAPVAHTNGRFKQYFGRVMAWNGFLYSAALILKDARQRLANHTQTKPAIRTAIQESAFPSRQKRPRATRGVLPIYQRVIWKKKRS